MDKTPKTTPKDFFLHIGIIATLYVSVISFIALWFRIIDAKFVDPLSYVDPYSTGISLAIASLIVIFPAFLVLSWLVHNDEKKHPEKREIKVRKWLIFLTVFLAGGAVLIDLITLVYTFLSGQELTARFLWKAFVVFDVAGGIFLYFVYKIRGPIADKIAKKLTVAIVLIVLASLFVGFVVMGSPQEQRERREDNRRVSDLSSIQWQVVNYWQQKEELPATLSDLSDSISGYRAPTDPTTNEPYDYRTTGPLSFELCATFATAFEDEGRPEYPRALSVAPVKGMAEGWSHDAGYTCFDREIDPELYPPRSALEKR